MDDIKGSTPHASRVNGIGVRGDDSVAFYVPLLEYPLLPTAHLFLSPTGDLRLFTAH